MKKALKIVLFFTVLFIATLSISVFAVDLDTLNITLDKTTVNPDQNVTINFNLGQPLGAYTFEVDFDDDLFDYVSTTGATGSVTDDVITATFYDTTGGTNPSSSMSITLKAKSTITTSNPTQFLITANGLANPDGSETFDDITVPIVKDVIVEPNYAPYTISINYTGDVIKDEEKPIAVSIVSSQGRYYDHLRLTAEVTKPSTTATAQLIGTDSADLEHDVILSGWGDAAGFGLGGNVNETYNFTGIFSEDGNYTLTLKLIDRDDSDAVIASATKTITVGQTEIVPEPEEIIPEETTIEEETALPKTGANIYAYLGTILVAAIGTFAIINKKHS